MTESAIGTEGLEVRHVRKEFELSSGNLSVLEDVIFNMERGQTLSITGPSGSGKSTLLNIIGSLDRPTSGSVILGGRDVTGLSGSELAVFRSRSVGFVFQEHHLLPQCTAIENVLLPTLAVPGGPRGAERAEDLLRKVGLAERMFHFPAQLSGGERQRVAIARALVNNPALLLCDEPTGNLDSDSGAAAVSLLLDLAAAENAMVIMVTHNMELAARFSRRMELRDGVLR